MNLPRLYGGRYDGLLDTSDGGRPEQLLLTDHDPLETVERYVRADNDRDWIYAGGEPYVRREWESIDR